MRSLTTDFCLSPNGKTQPYSFLRYIPLLTINTSLMIFAICSLLKQAFPRKCNGLFKIMKKSLLLILILVPGSLQSTVFPPKAQNGAEYSLTNISCVSITGQALFKPLGIIITAASFSFFF